MQSVNVHFTPMRVSCVFHFDPKCKSERGNALDIASKFLHLGFKVSFKPL